MLSFRPRFRTTIRTTTICNYTFSQMSQNVKRFLYKILFVTFETSNPLAEKYLLANHSTNYGRRFFHSSLLSRNFMELSRRFIVEIGFLVVLNILENALIDLLTNRSKSRTEIHTSNFLFTSTYNPFIAMNCHDLPNFRKKNREISFSILNCTLLNYLFWSVQ